eukprot:5382917-Prymnesium_polylepis.1
MCIRDSLDEQPVEARDEVHREEEGERQLDQLERARVDPSREDERAQRAHARDARDARNLGEPDELERDEVGGRRRDEEDELHGHGGDDVGHEPARGVPLADDGEVGARDRVALRVGGGAQVERD